MQYKGDDLDLRVPQGRQPRDVPAAADVDVGAGTARWPRASAYGSAPDPVWVDEVLLACCNYAYDIATLNGAAEVGLKHLVNAMSRVEPAARILEARGVRDAQLRRESGALIASEIPMSATAERVAPRRGPDFEDVLRRAAEQAGRRGAAATVEDVLWVMLNYARDLPSVLLLRRLTPDWQRLDWPRPRESAVPAAEPRAALSASAGFDGVAGRIAQIEDSVRLIHADLAAERRILADLIRDTQRDIAAQRNETAALRTEVGERTEALERTLQARNEGVRLTVQLSDRVQNLEKAVHAGLGEGARNWSALGQRLQAIEAKIEARPDSADIAPLIDRFGEIEQTISGRIDASARVWNGFAERLQALERLVEAGSGAATTALVERLATLETALSARAAAAEAETPSALTERLAGLERAVRAGFGHAVEQTSALEDRLEALERKLAAVQPAMDQSEAALLLDERLLSIERMLRDGVAELAAARAPGTAETMAATAEMLAARIGSIEQRLAALSEAGDAAARGRDGDLKELHAAIMRLGETQVTLASAIADWRHEAHNDFAAVNARIDRLAAPVPQASARSIDPTETESRAASPQSPVLSDPAAKPVMDVRIASAAAATPGSAAGSTRGGGFWWWLFGTSNVRRANREAAIRWQTMRERLRGGPPNG